MTLREWDALFERFREQDEQAEYRAALICSVLANVNRNPKNTDPFAPKDFMRLRVNDG